MHAADDLAPRQYSIGVKLAAARRSWGWYVTHPTQLRTVRLLTCLFLRKLVSSNGISGGIGAVLVSLAIDGGRIGLWRSLCSTSCKLGTWRVHATRQRCQDTVAGMLEAAGLHTLSSLSHDLPCHGQYQGLNHGHLVLVAL